MNSFRSEWHPPAARQATLSHTDRTVTTGSCFATRFGQWLHENKFRVAVNPAGVSYNPLSIHLQLQQSLLQQSPDPRHVVEREGVFVHLDYHAQLHHRTAGGLLEALQSVLHPFRESLQAASWLTITYGTAWVYVYQPSGRVVNNCQKIPAGRFERRLLKASEIVGSFGELKHTLSKTNPHLRVLLTLSPVRHLKDTLEGNSVSKAVLRTAIHDIQTEFPEVLYFPAYEMLLDDLRDYRFYEADLIHPNGQAEAYLWHKFSDTWFSAGTKQLLARWQPVKQALRHRPFAPGGPAHTAFLTRLLEQLEQLAPLLAVEEEMLAVRRQIEESA